MKIDRSIVPGSSCDPRLRNIVVIFRVRSNRFQTETFRRRSVQCCVRTHSINQRIKFCPRTRTRYHFLYVQHYNRTYGRRCSTGRRKPLIKRIIGAHVRIAPRRPRNKSVLFFFSRPGANQNAFVFHRVIYARPVKVVFLRGSAQRFEI